MFLGHQTLGGVEAAEVGGTVDDNTLDRDAEATVEANNAVRLDGLLQTIHQTGVLTLCATTDIGTQTGTGKVEGIHKAERSGSGGATGSQVSEEETPELGLLVNTTQENLFVHVLEGEVQGLRGEITDHIGQVTAPKGAEALFLWNTNKAIDDTCNNLKIN